RTVVNVTPRAAAAAVYASSTRGVMRNATMTAGSGFGGRPRRFGGSVAAFSAHPRSGDGPSHRQRPAARRNPDIRRGAAQPHGSAARSRGEHEAARVDAEVSVRALERRVIEHEGIRGRAG